MAKLREGGRLGTAKARGTARTTRRRKRVVPRDGGRGAPGGVAQGAEESCSGWSDEGEGDRASGEWDLQSAARSAAAATQQSRGSSGGGGEVSALRSVVLELEAYSMELEQRVDELEAELEAAGALRAVQTNRVPLLARQL